VAQVKSRIDELLTRRFPGSSAELEVYPETHKVGGYLIWDGFEAIEPLDRQRQLHQVLREEIGKNYRSEVTSIFAMTPAEVAVMREG
jgi:hypothetical protein